MGVINIMASILIVDDLRFKREALAMVLLGEGHLVLQAENGKEALRLLAQKTILPELIITDLIMTPVDGYELCKTVKSDPQLSHIPIIVNSIMDEEKVQVLSDDCQIQGFFPMAARRKDIVEITNLVLEGKGNSRPPPKESIGRDALLREILVELKGLSSKLP